MEKMRDSIDFKNMDIAALFRKLLLPTVLGMIFSALFVITDGIFVGKGIGSDALAAVNIVAPLWLFSTGIGLMFGVGASVVASIHLSHNKPKVARINITQSIVVSSLLLMCTSTLFCLFAPQVVHLLGGSERLEPLAVEYMLWFVPFSAFTALLNSGMFFLRLDGSPNFAMLCNITAAVLNIILDYLFIFPLGWGMFGAALATLIAQGISAVFSLLIFFYRMRRYKSSFVWFDGQELRSMLQIAVPSVLQQSTVSIGMMIVQAVVNPFGTQALAGYAATMRVENVFSLIFVSIGNAVSPYVSQNLGAKKIERIKKGYHAALVLDLCFAVLAFIVIETLHTQISSLFLGKDGTALAYQVSGDYMRWLGYFFIFMGIKMATDGVLRGLGIMRPFLIANMVNLAIRLSVALICAPRFGIAFVWLAVPAGWLANFLVSYAALRKSWPGEKVEPSRIFS